MPQFAVSVKSWLHITVAIAEWCLSAAAFTLHSCCHEYSIQNLALPSFAPAIAIELANSG